MNTDLYQGGRRLPIMEEFYTLQGEGYQTGKPAYFIRIGGCDIGCNWCDSKRSWSFGEHPLVDIDELVSRVLIFPAKAVVVTGGEPGLYPLEYLCDKLHQSGVMTYVETSGAYPLTGIWDWICLSPKSQSPPEKDNCKIASELKVIIEKNDDFEWAEKNAALVTPGCHLFLQPEWSHRNIMLDEIISYIGNNPKWRLSLQSHKYIGIP
ncbi:MAG: 7-carboxy-7-deazaguanine synthase QueE [Bacteroidota bacterium]